MGYELILTGDGSNTLYSDKYSQHYHSLRDGAVSESLYKHVIPALNHHKNKIQLNILDICFGIGYNTLSTIYYLEKNNINKKVNFFSPELDDELISSLKDFKYPKEFEFLKPIIEKLSTNKFYDDGKYKIEIFIGDAREYIKSLKNIDIVYQDAFSSDVNNELWTKEYFADIYKILNKDAILTTYSVATPVRLGLYENGFYLYEYKNEFTRKGTLGFKQPQDYDGFIDMELKKIRNPEAKAFRDQIS